jgi:hypothetical protein
MNHVEAFEASFPALPTTRTLARFSLIAPTDSLRPTDSGATVPVLRLAESSFRPGSKAVLPLASISA